MTAIEELTGGGLSDGSISCHGTLELEGGVREAGTLIVTDPGESAPLQVSWESDEAKARRPKAPDPAAPVLAAIHKYCATATSLVCSLYSDKAAKCVGYAADGYGILLYEREAQQKMGATPQQAAELAAMHNSPTLASKAQRVPAATSPRSFYEELMNDCLKAAADR